MLDACRELGITVFAYSPLGRGFLTGQVRSPDDLAADDFRRILPRFSPENFHKNLELVDNLQAIAARKGMFDASSLSRLGNLQCQADALLCCTI